MLTKLRFANRCFFVKIIHGLKDNPIEKLKNPDIYKSSPRRWAFCMVFDTFLGLSSGLMTCSRSEEVASENYMKLLQSTDFRDLELKIYKDFSWGSWLRFPIKFATLLYSKQYLSRLQIRSGDAITPHSDEISVTQFPVPFYYTKTIAHCGGHVAFNLIYF